MKKRINLGAGDRPIDGWENWDIKDGRPAFPLGVENDSVDEIRASHVLEHLSHRDAQYAVSNWCRALRPGGVLKIAVPDFEKISNLYLQGVPINTQGYVMGGHVDEHDRHGAIYDRECLTELLYESGMVDIGEWEDEHQDCHKLPISLNLRATKPYPGSPEMGGTRAALASARFGPALHHRCAYEAFQRLDIPYHVVVGCFWHQILSEAIEQAISNSDCTRVLTCDFDTIFTANDVRELHKILDAHSNLDAVVPVQSKRCSADALFTIQDESGKNKQTVYSRDFERTITPISTGHFGLTLFRADRLRSLARPWMIPTPNPETGRWDSGREDADISFWRNWHRAGCTVALANHVRVGHMQELITWPGKDFQPVHQTIEDYQRRGVPKEAAC